MKVSNEVLAVLSECELNGTALKIAGQLDRKMYVAVNKVLEVAGGKWNRSAKAHIFPIMAADALDPVFQTGEIIDAKQEFQAFYTPPKVAAMVIERAQIKPGMTVLEPSAGGGALAKPAALAGGIVTCIEVREKTSDISERWICGDFMDISPERFEALFDRIVMNPPFTKLADIDHVMHAVRFLKPNGKLVAIMSAGVLFRQEKKAVAFRNYVDEKGGSIEALPDGAFKEAGTNVKTVLVEIP